MALEGYKFVTNGAQTVAAADNKLEGRYVMLRDEATEAQRLTAADEQQKASDKPTGRRTSRSVGRSQAELKDLSLECSQPSAREALDRAVKDSAWSVNKSGHSCTLARLLAG